MPYKVRKFGNKIFKTLYLASLESRAKLFYGVVHFEFEGSLSRNSTTFRSVYRIQQNLARMCRIDYCTRSASKDYTEEVVSKLFNFFLRGPFVLDHPVHVRWDE